MARIPQPHPNEFNKAREVRRDNDNVANFVRSLENIDESISDYMNNVIAPKISEGGKTITVPVLFGNPERWKSARKDGYLRDQNGQILLPVIIIKRSGFGKSDKAKSLNRYLTISNVQRYSKKNKYDKLSIMDGVQPTHETYNMVYPDHIVLSYECMVWTSFIEHQNSIVEALNFADDSYWGKKDKYKFKVQLSDFDTSTELVENQERMVKATFTLEVEANIIPEEFANKMNTIKSYTPKRVLLMQEIELSGRLPNLSRYRNDKKSPKLGRTNLPQVSMISEYQRLFDYLTLNNQYTSTFNSSVASGDAVYSVSDTELSATPEELSSSITETDKYQIFINGVITTPSTYSLINSARLSGGTRDVTITLDNTLLGFDLSSNDEVVIKGKIVSI